MVELTSDFFFGTYFVGNKISTQTRIGTAIAIAGVVAIYSLIKATWKRKNE